MDRHKKYNPEYFAEERRHLTRELRKKVTIEDQKRYKKSGKPTLVFSIQKNDIYRPQEQWLRFG